MKLISANRWTLACAVLLTARTAAAQTDPADSHPPLQPALRELWVPSVDLAPVLERYPRAVPLDRDQLLTLLRDAHADAARDEANPPPVTAAVREARFEGWLATGPGGQTQVRVEARLEIEVLSDAWTDLPLGLQGITLGTAEIDDASAAGLRRAGGADGPASLEIQGRGTHRLHLGFLLPVNTGAEGDSVALPTVAGVGEFILHLPGGTRADSPGGCAVEPDGSGIVARVALRRSPGAPAVSPTAISDFTKLARSAPGPSAPVEPARLNWRTSPPASGEMGALLQSGLTEATVDESGVSIRQEIILNPALGRLPDEARFAMPAGASAVRVEGPSLGRWDLGADGLRLAFIPGDGHDATTVSTVIYHLPLPLSPQGSARFDLPLLEAAGAHRVTGELVVKHGRGITVHRIEPGPAAAGTFSRGEDVAPDFVAGFELVDLPAPGNSAPLVAARVEARRTATRFSVDADVRAAFELDGVRIARTLAFQVDDGDLFSARVKLPPGETVLAVHAADGSKEPDWRQDGDELRLTWTTGLPAASRTVLAVDTRAELAAPKPGVPVHFTLGSALVPGAERLTGYVALASAPAFRLVTTAGEDRLERRDGHTTPVRGDVAWFYRDDFRLGLRVERRAAETAARFTGYALPLAGAVEIHAQIDYEFRYSGVEAVRVRVPRDSADAFFFTGEHIAERRRDDDVWTIRFDGEQDDQYRLGVQATLPAPADRDDAQRFHCRLPVVVPLDSARWSGVWVVEANTDTEIRFATTGANEVDTLRAPPLAGYQPTRRVIGVFEMPGGTANTTIDLDGARHAAAGGAAAIVDRLDLETDASTSGVTRHRATIRARTAGDGFFDLRLPTGATLWSLTLDGTPVKPVGGAGASDAVRVELPGGRAPADASTVVVVYETPGAPWTGAGWRMVTAPRFDDGVPVVQSHWTLRVPDGYEYRFARALTGKNLPGAKAADLLIPRIAVSIGHAVQWVYYCPWFGHATPTLALPPWMLARLHKRSATQMGLDLPAQIDLAEELAEPAFASDQSTIVDLSPDMARPVPPAAKAAAKSPGAAQDWELPARVTSDAKGRRDFSRINDHSDTAAIRHKLQSIIIPNIEFRYTTLNNAVEFLRQEARRLDPSPDEADRGINIFLKLAPSGPQPAGPTPAGAGIPGLPPGAETPANTGNTLPPTATPTGNTRISLTLSNVSLHTALDFLAKAANLKIKVEPYAVSIVPLTEETGDMATIEIRVPPSFLEAASQAAPNQAATDVTGVGSVAVSRADAKAFLESSGLTFPPGSSAVYLPGSSKLVIRNTQANLDLASALVGESGEPRAQTQAPLLDGRENPRGVAGLLPLRLDLPTNGAAYEFEAGGEPGTLDFHYADWAVAARGRWIWLTLGALGFLFGAAGWAHPWRRTLFAALALTFFPLIVAPAATVPCNALLAGWWWAVAGWCVTRLLLRRRRFAPLLPLLCAAAWWPLSPASAAPDPAPELVIVPYDATRPAAKQDAARYYLPYERFLTLWDAAKRHRRPPATALPPGGERYNLGAARYDARLRGDTLEIDGTLDVQTFGEGWVGVPLRLESDHVGIVTLDGTPAALGGDGVLWIGAPGGHRVTVSLRLPAPNVAAGTRLSWTVPPTAATLVSLLVPRTDLRAELHGGNPEEGEVEEIVPEGRRLTASLGGTEKIELFFRDAPVPSPAAQQPALASVETRLTVSPREETLEAELRLSFPGSTQDHFTVLLDRSLTLTGLDAPEIRQWRLTTGGDRQTLEISLNTPARDAYRLTVTADRPTGPLPVEKRFVPLVSATATRVEQTAALLTAGAVELALPDGLPAGTRRVGVAASTGGRLFAAFAGDGTAVAYSVRAASEKRTAHIDYLYEVGRGKIELAASLRLSPAPTGEPLATADLRLPPGFAVEAVVGDAVQQWWRDGDGLSLRFRPGTGTAEVPLIVYLVRRFERQPERLTLVGLSAAGFTETDGEAVVAADRSLEVSLTLPANVRAEQLREIDSMTAAREFQVKAPLQRQRAFRYHGDGFEVTAALQTQPSRWQTQWVTQATVRDGVVAEETHVNATMLQGAADTLEFSLPPGLNEARVAGPEVRDTVVSGEPGERRTYRVIFQNPLYAGVEAGFTISLELPFDAGNHAVLPDLTLPGEGGRAAGGFVLVENASSGEMTLDPHGLEPAIEKDVPFLPPWIVAGTRFFRAAPGGSWSLGLRVTSLEKTAGRAALVAYAELTSTLRAGGEEWHRATYRLQNRRLQFLPVRLPAGTELIGARVAGESVRVDAGPAEKDGPPPLLVPLVRTRPGEMSYDVEIVYHRPARGPSERRGGRAFQSWQLQDPQLIDVPVEKTLWNVYLPNEARLLNAGGNLEPVVAALSATEKLEGALSDLRELSATYRSASASDEERRRALDNYNSLATQVTEQAKPRPSARGIVESELEGALFKKPNVASQHAAVGQEQQVILATVDSLNAANITLDQNRTNLFNGGAAAGQGLPAQGGFIQYGNPINAAATSAGQGTIAAWRDNRAADTQFRAGVTPSSAATPRPETNAGRDLALNDSVTVEFPGKEAEAAVNRKDSATRSRVPVARAGAAADQPERLSTARATNAPTITTTDAQAAVPALRTVYAAVPASPPPAAGPPPGGPSAANIPPAPRTGSLRSEGHISLSVDFPLEGQVYHFKKIKADAHLTLWSVQPARFVPLAWLAVLCLVLAAWWAAGRFRRGKTTRDESAEERSPTRKPSARIPAR